MRADEGNARAWNNLGFALEREQPLAVDAALDAYQRAIMLDPVDYKARINLRRLCAEAGECGTMPAVTPGRER